MSALIGIAVAVIALVFLVPLARRRHEGRDRSSSTADFDSTSPSWGGTTAPFLLGAAAADGDHLNRSASERDQDDRSGESGWGEHGAGGSWGDAGDSDSSDGGAGDGGDSDSGGSDGGSSSD